MREMKRAGVFLLSLIILIGILGVGSATSISYGTIGTGATATQVGSNVKLYTANGGSGSGYIRLTIPEGISLSSIISLLYTAKITNTGAGGFAPEVVLNIDADGIDGLEGTGIDWMLSSYNPSTLNGDNFLSGDNWPKSAESADPVFVNRDALSGYYYWSANDARTALSSTLWTLMSSIVFPIHGIDSTDKVYSIDFVVGTSGNFDDMEVLFSSIELNGVEYTPWITQSQGSVITTTNPTFMNMIGTTNTTINLTTSQIGTVTVQQYSQAPHGGFSAISLGKYVEIQSTIPNSAISNVEIRIYYTDAELAASHVVESSLKLYWYNSVSGNWEVVVPSGVNTIQNYVWGITNHFSTYTLGGGSGPAISVSNSLCGGYTNNASAVLFGSAFDSSGQIITIVAYNRSDDAPGVVRNAALVPPPSSNMSFNTQPNDPPFTAGNNSIFIWGGSNQTGPITVCQFLIDTQTPNQVTNVQTNNYFGCAPNYVNVAPNFTWSPTIDNGGAGINHYEFYVYNASSGLVLYSDNTTQTNMAVNSPVNNQSYYIEVRAVDAAGNLGAWSSLSSTVYFDNQLPSATITGEDWSVWYNRNFNVSETDTDNLGLFKCEIAITGNGSSPVNYFQVPCNQNYLINITQYCPTDGADVCWIRKRATDNACNQLISAGHKWDLDRTVPTTTKIVGIPSVFWNGPFGGFSLLNYFLTNIATITLNCNDGTGSGCSTTAPYYRITYPNGSLSNLINYTTPFPLNGGDGFYNVSYYSTDKAGNIELLKSEIDKVDTQAPITTKTIGQLTYINSSGAMFVNGSTPFLLSCADSEVGCNRTFYQIDSGVVNSQIGNITFTLNGVLDGKRNISYWSEDNLTNTELIRSQYDYLDTMFPLITLHNPSPTEINVSRCVQAVVVEANDLGGSGVNDNSLVAKLWNSSNNIQNISLKKSVYGTYEALMDKQLPAGNYTLKVYASDNLGNRNVYLLNETLMDSVFVEFVNPASCSVNPSIGGSCDFTFNICMRGGNAVQFWMNKLGDVVTPDMMGATISSGTASKFVGLWNGTWFSPAEILQLSPSVINGRTSFNLHLNLNTNVTQSIGPGVHDLQYYINSTL